MPVSKEVKATRDLETGLLRAYQVPAQSFPSGWLPSFHCCSCEDQELLTLPETLSLTSQQLQQSELPSLLWPHFPACTHCCSRKSQVTCHAGISAEAGSALFPQGPCRTTLSAGGCALPVHPPNQPAALQLRKRYPPGGAMLIVITTSSKLLCLPHHIRYHSRLACNQVKLMLVCRQSYLAWTTPVQTQGRHVQLPCTVCSSQTPRAR